MSTIVRLADGLVCFERRLDVNEQRALWSECRALADGPVPMYTPTVRGGRRMSVGMLCLGKHWNGMTYSYENVRSDFDRLAVPPIPPAFVTIAESAAADAGFTMRPDLCILNYYTAEARMGVHQDKDERPETIAAGIPIVSVSLGDAARFVIGGLTRRDLPRHVPELICVREQQVRPVSRIEHLEHLDELIEFLRHLKVGGWKVKGGGHRSIGTPTRFPHSVQLPS